LLAENQNQGYDARHHDRRRQPCGQRERRMSPIEIRLISHCMRDTNGQERTKEKSSKGSTQPLEKVQNGQENPRKAKPFSLIVFARPWLDLDRFG
jgi:hypothetical protein